MPEYINEATVVAFILGVVLCQVWHFFQYSTAQSKLRREKELLVIQHSRPYCEGYAARLSGIQRHLSGFTNTYNIWLWDLGWKAADSAADSPQCISVGCSQKLKCTQQNRCKLITPPS